MARYIDNPQEQKDEGDMIEWETIHILQDVANFTVLHLQHQKSGPALIFYPEKTVTSPDLYIMRGSDHHFVEIKSKLPTSYGTYGYNQSTLRQYEKLSTDHNIHVMLIVRDKTIAPLGSNDLSAYRFAFLSPYVMRDAFNLKGITYLKAEHFEPLLPFLLEDREDFEDYHQNLKDFAAGRCESFVDVIDRLIAADAEGLNALEESV